VTSVYITAPFPERDYAIEVMTALEQAGIVVTSRWLKAPDELTDEHARKDLDDVAACDVLVVLNPVGWEERGTGGRHVELGYALFAHKPIVLVGPRTNIFHYLSCVTVYAPVRPAGTTDDYTELAALLRTVADRSAVTDQDWPAGHV
jgi:hypothetical protein